MVDLMSSIICEGDTVSQELLDTVLVNLVPAHKVRAWRAGACFHKKEQSQKAEQEYEWVKKRQIEKLFFLG